MSPRPRPWPGECRIRFHRPCTSTETSAFRSYNRYVDGTRPGHAGHNWSRPPARSGRRRCGAAPAAVRADPPISTLTGIPVCLENCRPATAPPDPIPGRPARTAAVPWRCRAGSAGIVRRDAWRPPGGSTNSCSGRGPQVLQAAQFHAQRGQHLPDLVVKFARDGLSLSPPAPSPTGARAGAVPARPPRSRDRCRQESRSRRVMWNTVRLAISRPINTVAAIMFGRCRPPHRPSCDRWPGVSDRRDWPA